MNYELRPLRGSLATDAELLAPDSNPDRSRLLLEFNNAIVAQLDFESLLSTVFECVKQVFRQTIAATLSVYDSESNQLRVHLLHSPEPELFREGMPIALEATPSGLAFTSGQTVLIQKLVIDDFPSDLIKRAFADGIRSGCSVPLICHNRVVGTLTVGAAEEGAYSEADADLLTQVGQQIAMPIENALNFHRAEKERDRNQLLLEIANAITTNLDLANLLKAIFESLGKRFHHDAAALSLYDAQLDQFRMQTHEVNYQSTLELGMPYPAEGTPAGTVLKTRTTLRVPLITQQDFPAYIIQQSIAAGLRSGCCIPLIVHDEFLGVIEVVSRRENAFSEQDAELLTHIGKQIAIAVKNALSFREIATLKNKLASEKIYLEEEIQTQYNFEEIVGQSDALKTVLNQVATVARTDSVVLICGETGTGKELIARAIHNLSGRRERTLVKLNCAAIPTGLLESELFGHEKGAFTGAIAQRIGRFELAHKGTLLLDEIGEIPIDLQPKLLRVLQEQEFERLGSSRTIKADVRLVAATNCDLQQMVLEKKFRSDLFYRLNVFPIRVPPLRERREDIPLLAAYFAQKHSLRMNKKIDVVPKQTMLALQSYHWPGNVRELENFIERAVILSHGSELQAPLLELKMNAPVTPQTSPLITMEDMERAHIEEVLRHTRGVIAGKGGAAEILSLPASTLRGRMKKLGIK